MQIGLIHMSNKLVVAIEMLKVHINRKEIDMATPPKPLGRNTHHHAIDTQMEIVNAQTKARVVLRNVEDPFTVAKLVADILDSLNSAERSLKIVIDNTGYNKSE